MKNLFIGYGLLQATLCSAQVVQQPVFIEAAGMGAYSNRFTDCFSSLTNPASLSSLPHFTAGVLAEKKFMLAELNHFIAVLGIPAGKGGIGITTGWYGNSDYNETAMSVAYGKKLGKVNIGIAFRYTMLRIAGYGSDAATGFTLGSTWQVTPEICAGFELVNPAGGKFSKNPGEKLPAIYKTGLGYEVSEKLLLVTEVIKEENKPVSVHAGMQYKIAGKLITRFGITTAGSSPYFGAGWRWKNMRVEVLAGYHTRLGITPGLMLVYTGKNRKG